MKTAEELNGLTETAIGAGMRAHRGAGGAGLLESAYQPFTWRKCSHTYGWQTVVWV